MEQKPLATEIINDMQERLINVVCEIDSLDIVSKIQSCISDIVIRERNSKHDKGED